MKKTMIVLGVLATGYASSQDYTGKVGINTEKPKATLDIRPKTTDGSKAEGLLTPQLTGDQLKVMTANLTAENNGLLVFVTAPVTAADASTANVLASGYYRFNISGTTKYWVRIEPSGLERIANTIDATNRAYDSWRLIGETAGRSDSYPTGNVQVANIDMALLGNEVTPVGTNGMSNISIGVLAYAEGNNNIAVGYQTNASGDNSTAIGVLSSAAAEAVAIRGAALGVGSVAVKGEAKGGNSLAMIGGKTDTNASNSVAIGEGAQATGELAYALGYMSLASGDNSFAHGIQATAQGESSLVLGDNSSALGIGGVAIGANSNANGRNSIVIGGGTAADEAVAIKGDAMGNNSLAMLGAMASGISAISMGSKTKATGDFSFAVNSQATANYATALAGGQAIGDHSVSIGANSIATQTGEVNLGNKIRIVNDLSQVENLVLKQGSNCYRLTVDATLTVKATAVACIP